MWADFKNTDLLPDRILYLSLLRALNPENTGRDIVFSLLDEAEAAGIAMDTKVGR